VNVATKSSRRRTYENASSGVVQPRFTSVDLGKVCGFTYLPPIGDDVNYDVEFHMCSGTIFSVRMNEKEFNELENLWAYWSDEQ
jgi:hypothetical protein